MRNAHLTIALVLLVLVSLTAAMAQETVWNADLSAPTGGFTAYRTETPSTIDVLHEDNVPIVVARTPGNSALEGIQVAVTGLPGGRLVTFVAEVRGSGEIWPMVLSGNGWLYSKTAVALSDDWQSIEITKPLGVGDTRASLTLVTKTPQKVRLEVRAASARVEPALKVFDQEVVPVRLNAFEFAERPAWISEMPGSLAPKVVANAVSMVTSGMPCPRTSRPIYVYIRAKMPERGGYFSLLSRAGSALQRLNRYDGRMTDDWQWVRAQPVAAGQFADDVALQYYGPKDARATAAIDAIVLTTLAELSDEDLNNARVLSLSGRGQLSATPAVLSPVLDGKWMTLAGH